MAGTAVSLRCFSFLKHMFCCERAHTDQRVHGDEVHLPALWCYTVFKAAAVFVFSLSVCQRTIIRQHPGSFFSSYTSTTSPDFCISLFYMLQHFTVNTTTTVGNNAHQKLYLTITETCEYVEMLRDIIG